MKIRYGLPETSGEAHPCGQSLGCRPPADKLPGFTPWRRVLRFKAGWTALIGLALITGLSTELRCDSLWTEGEATSLVADVKAAAVGDILTIIVQENDTSSKEKSTKTQKKAGTDASIETFLYSPDASGLLTHNGKMPALKYSMGTDFSGGGQIKNSDRITARITVSVIDVLPNGQLMIEGRKRTSFSGEMQEAILRGIVRVEDITSSNTVFSYHVADASIEFISKGVISDSQRKGWFTRFWDKVNPF